MTKVGVVLVALALVVGARAWVLWDREDTRTKSRNPFIEETRRATPDWGPPFAVGGVAAVLFLSGVVVVSASETRRPLPVSEPDARS